MRVVYSQDTHRRGDPEWLIWPEHCREGSWGWEIIAVEVMPDHVHVFVKVRPTPQRFPRRAGVARKRPLGGL